MSRGLEFASPPANQVALISARRMCYGCRSGERRGRKAASPFPPVGAGVPHRASGRERKPMTCGLRGRLVDLGCVTALLLLAAVPLLLLRGSPLLSRVETLSAVAVLFAVAAA